MTDSEVAKLTAQLRSSAEEIGRLRAALETIANNHLLEGQATVIGPLYMAGIGAGLKMQADIARAALATPTTETP